MKIETKKIYTTYTEEVQNALKKKELSKYVGNLRKIAEYVSLSEDGEIFLYSSITDDSKELLVSNEEFIKQLEGIK